jgi:hypothetical protein
MSDNFVYQLGVFRKRGIRNMRLVASLAIKDVLEAAQTPQRSAKYTGGAYVVGKIPVLHNVLRESLMSSKNGGGWARGSTSYLAVTSALNMGDVLSFYWDTPYALRIERGFRGTDSFGRNYNQGGRFFMTTAFERFNEFVRARAAEVNKK